MAGPIYLGTRASGAVVVVSGVENKQCEHCFAWPSLETRLSKPWAAKRLEACGLGPFKPFLEGVRQTHEHRW